MVSTMTNIAPKEAPITAPATPPWIFSKRGVKPK